MMQASGVVTEPIEVEYKEVKFTPVEFENKFLEREDLQKNPLTQAVKIGTGLKYQKVP